MYLDENNISPPESDDENKHRSRSSFRFSRYEKIVTFKANLVSTVNETIKNMVKQVYREHRIKLQPESPNNQLSFKVRGRKEYFTGNHPMLAYRQVRNSLRGMDYLMVNLVEVPKKSFYPPSVLISDTELLTNLSDFFIFYSPFFPDQEPTPSKLMKPRVFLLKNANPVKDREDLTDSLLKGAEIRDSAFSGECEWPFRVRICGVENLFNVFAEAFRGNAVNNGTENPGYVVLPKIKEKKNREGHVRRKSSGSLERRSSIPILKNQHKKTMNRGTDYCASNSAYLNNGPSSSSAQELTNEFKLPFAPDILSYDVMLLHGDSVISNCFIRSSYSPFNYSSRLME